jgi:hypothetical protein
MKRLLKVIFDVETMSHGWDVKLRPVGRLYYRRKFTTSGVERRVGLYRFGQWERAVEWWVAG